MIYINIALATFGLLATLAAFGGETWRKGNQPIFKRITKRGWLALFCIVTTFSLGVDKEIKTNERAEAQTLKNKKLQGQLSQKQDEISDLLENISTLQLQISGQQLASIEAAFNFATKIPRETDDCLVHLDGQSVITLPSRYNNQLYLYWGDSFHYTIFSEHHDPAELASLTLEVGERSYPLHDGETSGNFEREIRIYGKNPRPMVARIKNPRGLYNVILKVFVRTTDTSQGQEEFRRLIVNSPFYEIAKRMYKTTTADILRVRYSPSFDAAVRFQLAKGAFVRVLQVQENWTEILTP